MKKLSALLLLLGLSLFLQAQPNFIKRNIESYILKGMKDWDVPGLSIVIVKDGKVV